jgi:hypothetical protein
MSACGNPNRKRLVLLVWVLVAVFYFCVSYDYIRVTSSDQQFGDYVHFVVQLAGNEGRSAKDIRNLLLAEAEKLSLPVRGEQIAIAGAGDSLNVDVNYKVDIEVPLLQREIFTKSFEHRVKYQTPR